ncbi:pimeloyl-ACP methyl ester carboxylesterase [Mycolicibacterium sp. BK634]|uniref:alpha/beta hydrolase n=1 Tax=Mycolicibacterium sp. BK634 TaxID=2587099 RepID=UPI00161D5B32|nr:alpha/beta hydrolase [Mycolicibacterium sp. BK634]MBB3751323.1 pimeloyl-ACP methyl ester carboxylesterase [Mycolicibacterium sp. BK634]
MRLRARSFTALTSKIRAVAALAAMVLVAGCSTAIDGKPQATTPALGPPAPVAWSPCRTAGAECGAVEVPVDYSEDHGPVARLALVRFPATGQKIGSLVVNPGGPGVSGVDAAVKLVNSLPPQVRQRFDFVGFDPRGIGASTPALWCNSDADNDANRADPQVDYSPSGVEHIENLQKQFAQRCLDKMGVDFLANVGTLNVARDLDRIRMALGDEKLTYLGYSYGTDIGSTYAEAYPDKVRAMILDGAVDPNADPLQAGIDQAAAFQKAFNDYVADCINSGNCPLGDDPAKSVDAYHRLVDPLVANPAPTLHDRELGYSDAITGTLFALYSPTMWSTLSYGLSELAQGRGDVLLKLADAYWSRDSHGHYTNANDVQNAVNCVDAPPNADRAKAVDQDRQLRQVAPFATYGPFTGNAPLGICAFWPVPPSSGPHVVSAPGLPPVLVVSTTHDPATPYQSGVELARDLGGVLLTFDGTQHTVVFHGETCVDDYATAYLIDLALPPKDSRC